MVEYVTHQKASWDKQTEQLEGIAVRLHVKDAHGKPHQGKLNKEEDAAVN